MAGCESSWAALTDVFHAQQLRPDDPQIDLADDTDVENGSEASTAPAVPVNPDPNMPLAVYRAPSALPSDDLISSAGPSLIPPTLATSDSIPMPQSARSVEWPTLALRLEDDEKIRNTPFEIEPEGPPMASTTVTAEENPSTLPWKFEFQWEGGHVHASWGSLGSVLVSFSRHSIDISRATVGSSNGFSESTHASAVLVLPKVGDCLATAVWTERETSWARKARRGALVRILIDHYLRTHTSQGATRRHEETGQHSTNSPSSAPFPATTPVRPSAGRGSSRRFVNRGGSGGGEDGDRDDGDHDGFRHPKALALSQARFFACPFYKWRPKVFKQCIRRFRNPSEVKTHLFERHYLLKCPQCHFLVETELGLAHHSADTGCGDNPTPDTTFRFGYISKQQLDDIQKRPPKRHNREMQWRNIFQTILPNEPQPRDIFIDRRVNNAMQHIENHFQMCCRYVLEKHQAQQARDDPFSDQFDTPKAQRKAVEDEFPSSLMQEVHGQEPPEWSIPFAPHSNSQNYSPGTFATDSSLFPSDTSQNQSLTHAALLTPDALKQNHNESVGVYYNFVAGGSSLVSPFSPDWHLGSQFNIQPIRPFNIDDAMLDPQPMTTHVVEQHTSVDPQLRQDFNAQLKPQPMTTHVVEQHPSVVPQLGQDFDAQLNLQPNEGLFEIDVQHMFRPGPHSHDNNNNNDNGSINPTMFAGSSTLAGLTFLPRIHGLSPTAVTGSCSYAPMPINGAYDNATMSAVTAFGFHHTQGADMMGSTPLSYSGSSYLSHQGTLTNAEAVPLPFHHYNPETRAYGEGAVVTSFPFRFA